MKKLSHSAGILGLAVLLWLVFRSSATDGGCATPDECVQAYFLAVRAADTAAYLTCLETGYRAKVQQEYTMPEALADYLRLQGQDLHNVTQVEDPHIDGDRATVIVDQTFSSGQKRQKILLVKIGNSWYISGSEQAQTIPTDVPHGTHVGKVP